MLSLGLAHSLTNTVYTPYFLHSSELQACNCEMQIIANLQLLIAPKKN